MMHVGLDLCRQRLDVCVLDAEGAELLVTTAAPDAGGLVALVERLAVFGQPVAAAIESMTGARNVCDELVGLGWSVRVADAAKVAGITPVACKTDRVDAWALAELSRREMVPEIWLPPLAVRQARELSRWRRHLVKHRTMLKNRIHSTLMTFGVPCPVSDLFGVTGRQKLAGLDVPAPWAGDVAQALAIIDGLDAQIDQVEEAMRGMLADPELRCRGYVPRLLTVPGVGSILGFVIAVEIGDITRFAAATKFVGYTGLCAKVHQSGNSDRRGPLSKHGPKYLRWALIEAATHACTHPAYAAKYQRTCARLGRTRGKKIARIELARQLAKAIWVMLTRDKDFAPASAPATGGHAPADATRDLAA